MDRSVFRRLVPAVLAWVLFAVSGPSTASGGDGFMENIYTPEFHVPPAELPDYAAGSVGILVPTYWRAYHFLAYRALTGHALSKEETALLNVHGWEVGDHPGGSGYIWSDDVNGVGNWMKARARVNGAPEVKVGVEADIGNYAAIINCQFDAFDRAAKTLEQRISQGGQQWAAVWLANQDAVFANCSPPVAMEDRSKPLHERRMVMPAPLPPKSPEWLVKDHAYQSAAAMFYSGRYDEARERFLAIAKDAKSPWQSFGKYLAARCLLRKASVMPSGPANKEAEVAANALFEAARKEMVAIGVDFAPAKRLITWIDFRLRPEGRRRELSSVLSTAKIAADTPQMVTDYLYLLDGMAPEKMIGADDAMTAWIGAMQASAIPPYSGITDKEIDVRRHAAIDMARAQWDKKHESVWLVPLLVNAKSGDLKPAELKAAAAVKENAPAYVHLQYHLARLDLDEGKPGDADAIVSAILKQPLPPSVRNRWRRMKMVTAKSAEEFFAAAPRAYVNEHRGTPIPNEGAGQKVELNYDEDLHWHLMRDFSLETLLRLKPMIPAAFQKQVSEFMWTRAVILGDFATADKLTDDVAKGRDTTRHLYERFKQAATPDEKRTAAMVIMANTPELGPAVTGTKEQAHENLLYWTCYETVTFPDNMGLRTPAFLADQERTQAAQEQTKLRTLPRRSTYLIPPVIEWAKKNKADPEAPKALHFLVASTRNECGFASSRGDTKRNYSKEAFQLLHSQFPKSEWTAKTKYYY